MVLDVGGVDDHSFNQSSWAGLQAANKANPNIKISYVPSSSQNDYTPNLTAETNKGCDTVIAVGGLMTDAVTKIAKKNPDQQYAADRLRVDRPERLRPAVQHRAGRLPRRLPRGRHDARPARSRRTAASTSRPSRSTWTASGRACSTTTSRTSKNVQVLGWDESNQKGGTFANSFTDANKGKQITQQFQQQGADIVFPVAGGTGVGSAAAAAASGGQLSVIWVDTDGCESVAQYCKYFLTSVTKNLTGSVQEYVDEGRRRAPSRPATTSARWRTTAPASRRSTTSTARSRRT